MTTSEADSAIKSSLPKRFHQRAKTQSILQMENVECGAACLGMILGYYEKHIGLGSLRVDCGVSRDGVNALNIIQAAKSYKLNAIGYNKDCDELYKLRAPVIIYWEFNHFVVLEGFNRKGAFINDPAAGHRLVTHAEFSRSYTGVVLEFEPATDFQPEGRRFNVLPGLIRRCGEHVSVLIFLALISISNVLPIILLAAATSIFTDRILSGSDQLLFHPVLITWGLAASAIVILTFVYRFYLRQLQIGLLISLSTAFTHHLLHLPIAYFQQRSPGEVISRDRLNDNVAGVISQGVVQFVNDLVSMLVFCAVMFLLSWKLTSIAIIFTAPLYVYMRWSANRRIEASMAVAMESGKVAGIAIESVSAMEVYKASGQESSFFVRWANAFSRATEKQQQLAIANLLPQALTDTLTQVASVAVLLMGALEIMQGSMSLGEVIAFQMLMIGFTGPIDSLSRFYSDFQQLQGELERLDDVLQHPEASCFQQESTTTVTTSLELLGKLELVDVCFRYSPVDLPFIEGINLSIAPGQRIAIVGASGSGKSTLAKLAAGICQPEHGQILLDNRDLTDWPSEVLAGAVAMVAQETFLIEGTLRENLTLWDPTVPEQNIIAACRDAEIWNTIEALPNLLSSEVAEEGANFSGGERQRLEIARALLYEPSLLILDEATSAIDSDTEKRIDQNLRLRGCTCLIVAHRLSTIRDCEAIIVLGGGIVVEIGTHDELWQADGEYRQLYASDDEGLQ